MVHSCYSGGSTLKYHIWKSPHKPPLYTMKGAVNKNNKFPFFSAAVVAVSSVLKQRSSCALEFVQTSQTCSPGVFYGH